jgi:hypothetical protein
MDVEKHLVALKFKTSTLNLRLKERAKRKKDNKYGLKDEGKILSGMRHKIQAELH